MKTAYITGVIGVDEKQSIRIHETEVSTTFMAAAGSIESAETLIKKLTEEGYSIINLGLGFDDETAEELQQKTGDKVKIRCVQYNINECAKLIKAERDRSRGIIMTVAGINRPCEFFIPDKEHDTRIVLVKNMAQAKNAARKLVKYNVSFIELSSWFDIFRMEDVIDAIEGAVPVGTCGILDILELERVDQEPEVDPEKLMPKKRVYNRRR